jgi:hypothetical protein
MPSATPYSRKDIRNGKKIKRCKQLLDEFKET